jgi:hypothetical protein
MMTILKNVLEFIKNPKNTRMIVLGAVVILLLLFLRQCEATKAAKIEIENQRRETQRVSNNYKAAMDTITQYQVGEGTWRAEKAGFELTLEELESEYASLLGDFKVEKNKPPKVVIRTEYVIKEVFNDVVVLVEIDSLGNTKLTLNDSLYHDKDSVNYRILSGKIPYKIIFDSKDSLYKAVPDNGTFELTFGMNLNLGLFQDKKTREISILADTDYPGVTFTKLNGASIMEDPKNKEIIKSMRKPWSLGLNFGYGAMINSGSVSTGPYVGFGLNYSPRFLQWGK